MIKKTKRYIKRTLPLFLPPIIFKIYNRRIRSSQYKFRYGEVDNLKMLIKGVYDLARARFPERQCYLLSDQKFHLDFCKSVQDLSEVKDKIEDCAFIVLFESDENAASALEIITKEGGIYTAPKFIITAQYIHKDNHAAKAISMTKDRVKEFSLSHYGERHFQYIMQAIKTTRGIEGDYVEIGTFTGTSGVAALSYMQTAGIKRKAYFLDTFKGFQYEEAKNSADFYWFGSHVLKKSPAEHKEFVRKVFGGINAELELIECNICKDDLPEKIEKIAVCNIDVDIYEAILSGLCKVAPRMSDYGIIIVDDSGHTPSLIGAEMAVRHFLNSDPGKMFMPLYLESGQTFLIKKKR